MIIPEIETNLTRSQPHLHTPSQVLRALLPTTDEHTGTRTSRHHRQTDHSHTTSHRTPPNISRPTMPTRTNLRAAPPVTPIACQREPVCRPPA